MEDVKIKLSNIIAPAFHEIHKDIKQMNHTFYWLAGGRGSCKSSFVGIEIPLNIMNDAKNGIHSNAVVLRKLENTLSGSVYAQICWGIDMLGVGHLWKTNVSPLSITYIPTGQKIIFLGADNPTKIKSTKFKKGYAKYIWYEELSEFKGMEWIRNINQSLMRGGKRFIVFLTYNPPKSSNNWVNKESIIERDEKILHTSNYTTVPPEWLGAAFINEAEYLKSVSLDLYEHEYIGIVNGTGGEIFNRVIVRNITDDEIKRFDNVKRGLDWGYATDPLHYTENYYDKTRRTLYIYREIHEYKMGNRKFVETLLTTGHYNIGQIVTCDSAEPKSIDEIKLYGIRAIGAKKGQGSVEYGIKWLQELENIVIDSRRCPNTAIEFTSYCLESDGHGGFKNEYPDKNNHSIDATRYSREDEVNERKIKLMK